MKAQSHIPGALAHMEEKYGEKFEYVRPHGSSYNTPGHRQIKVSCESFPDEEILVVISGKGKNAEYSDNYMKYYFRPQTIELISEVASKYFDEFTVTVSIAAIVNADDITSATSFDEYIHHKNSIVSSKIEIDDIDIVSSHEEILKNFFNELIGLGMRFYINADIKVINERFRGSYYADEDGFDFRRKGTIDE